MATYTHSSQLIGTLLKENDEVLINGKFLVVRRTYFLNPDEDKHTDFCKSIPDLHELARQCYSDQSDMSGSFPQYTNLDDATKIASALMKRNETETKEFKGSAPVPRYATEDGTSDLLTDIAPRRTSEWIPHHICDGDPAPEKKKPRIQFSKIR